jgi:hypothetical protein
MRIMGDPRCQLLLHASHHRPSNGAFKPDDAHAAIFAVPSIVVLAQVCAGDGGQTLPGSAPALAIYGGVYSGFHDWTVHHRLPHRHGARYGYLKRIVQVPRLRLAVKTKHGGWASGSSSHLSRKCWKLSWRSVFTSVCDRRFRINPEPGAKREGVD